MWNIKDTFIGVIWNKTEVCGNRDDFCICFSTPLAILLAIIFYHYSLSALEKSIIYVGIVYNKNIKIIILIIVLPGSTRLWSNETGQHLL